MREDTRLVNNQVDSGIQLFLYLFPGPFYFAYATWLCAPTPVFSRGFDVPADDFVPVDVEIHRLPVNTEYATVFSSELIFSLKKSVPGKTNCYVPDDTHKIAHNFIHSQLSNSGYRFRHISLRDFYDCYLLSKRTEPAKAFPYIEEKTKAAGYFLFCAKMTGLEDNSLSTENIKAKRHVRRVIRALDHPHINHCIKTMMKFNDLVFKRYLSRVLKATYRQSSRQYIRRRLSDPHWYKLHVKGLRKYFKG